MKHAALFLCVASLTYAHEIGTSRVSVLFDQNRTYDIEIVTDAAALAEKLSVPILSPQQMDALEEIFLRRITIQFNGHPVRPALRYRWEPAENDQSAPAAIFHLTGDIPSGASAFTWNFGWTFATYALEARASRSQKPVTQWVEGGEPSEPIVWSSLQPPSSEWIRYLSLGFTHIVPEGTDHILFVLGIFLLSRKLKPMLLQVSAFTLAHSITVGLSLYGLVSAPSSIVEPAIAISIGYVAIENIFQSELKPWRLALVFAFGLLHGLGFAGALRDLDLPRADFATALIGFNLGVEAGQLTVIAAAFLLVGWHFGNRKWYRARVVVPASALIACAALYWTVQRLQLG